MEPVARDTGTHDALKMDAAGAPWKDIVGRDQKPAKVPGVYGISVISGPYQVIRYFGRLSRPPQFDAAFAFCNEIIMDGQRIRLIADDSVLQIHKSHACNPEGVLGACNIDPGLSIDICVFRVPVA